MPSRSDLGLAAADIFYNQFNDVAFFVEDEDQENLYHVLMRRMFPKLKITQIFPLRGKANVIRHALNAATSSGEKPSVYLLDKDFDDLLGKLVVRNNIFYLNRYCIENYLMEEPAVLQIALESNPKNKRDELRRAIAYPKYLAATVKSLNRLFRLFYTVQRFELGIRNCDCSAEMFCDRRRRWQLLPSRVASYEQEVWRKAQLSGVFRNEREFARFVKNAFPAGRLADAHVSGKFLVEMTANYLRSHVQLGTASLDSLKYRLACHGSARKFRPLRARVSAFLTAIGVTH